MNDIISYKDVEGKVLTIRGQKAILDSNVAELYYRMLKVKGLSKIGLTESLPKRQKSQTDR